MVSEDRKSVNGLKQTNKGIREDFLIQVWQGTRKGEWPFVLGGKLVESMSNLSAGQYSAVTGV